MRDCKRVACCLPGATPRQSDSSAAAPVLAFAAFVRCCFRSRFLTRQPALDFKLHSDGVLRSAMHDTYTVAPEQGNTMLLLHSSINPLKSNPSIVFYHALPPSYTLCSIARITASSISCWEVIRFAACYALGSTHHSNVSLLQHTATHNTCTYTPDPNTPTPTSRPSTPPNPTTLPAPAPHLRSQPPVWMRLYPRKHLGHHYEQLAGGGEFGEVGGEVLPAHLGWLWLGWVGLVCDWVGLGWVGLGWVG